MLFQRKLNNQKNKKFQICPFKLKINEKEASSFRIKDENIDESIKKTLEYLNSSNEDYVKFGVFLFQRYFFVKASESEEAKNSNKTYEFYIDKFLEHNFIENIQKLLMKNNDPYVLYDSLCGLINFTNFPSINNQFDYYELFSSDKFLEIYKKIIMNDNSYIVTNLYEFLYNLCYENQICLNKLYQNNFLQLSLNKYASNITNNYQELIEYLHFIAVMAKNVNLFSSKEKENFFRIFYKFLSNAQEDEIIACSLIGLNYLNEYDKSDDSTIVNLIKENYNFINMLISINYLNYPAYLQLNLITVFKILINYFEKIESNNILNILNNTQILEFFSFIYNSIERPNIHLKILEAILIIIKSNDLNIILKVTRHNILNSVILTSLTDFDFSVRKTGLLIILNVLNINNFDVAADFSKTVFIEYLVQKFLKNETEKDIIKLSLEIIYCFIKSGNVFGNKNPFSQNLRAAGIEDILNKENNFLTDDITQIIEKIKKELNIDVIN